LFAERRERADREFNHQLEVIEDQIRKYWKALTNSSLSFQSVSKEIRKREAKVRELESQVSTLEVRIKRNT